MRHIILGLALGFFTQLSCADVDIDIIARRDVPEQTISQIELVNIFTRKMVFWPDGHRISVFIHPLNSIEHKYFSINVLNLSPFRYKVLSDSIIYSGVNSAPEEIRNDTEMLIKVSSTPYSIGYLNYTTILVNDNSNEIIRIDIK